MKPAVPPAERSRRVRRLLALPLLLAAAGCASLGATTHNLGELHDEQGRHKREGALMGGLQYEVRNALGLLFATTRMNVGTKPPAVIKDPLARCLENLIALEEMAAGGASARAAGVEQFSRLAIEDPWELSREACVRALTALGLELEVREHGRVQTPEVPADVEAVGSRLGALASAWLPLARAGELDAEAAGAAIAGVRALEPDVQGGLRVLRVLRSLLRGVRDDPRAAPLAALEADVQRRQIQLALLAAWRDQPPRAMDGSHPGWPSVRVRAEAMRGLVTIHGESALAEYLGNLDKILEPQLMLALLGLVERHGLPREVQGMPAETLAPLREAWIDGIFDIAADHPEGQVRVAAMLALSKVSGGELRSLREEDWYAWLNARRGRAPQEIEPAGEGAQGP